jgi:hypothetical protein
MSNGYGKAKAVAELALKFGFPGAGTTAVAAAGIGKDEQVAAAIVAISAVAFPPTGDGVGGEGYRPERSPGRRSTFPPSSKGIANSSFSATSSNARG